MGVRTVMITGDNPLTAATIAKQAGVDDFVAESHARIQARLHPQGAGRRQTGRDDGRRHQRRAGAGAGRRRPGDELRAPRPPRKPATWSTSTAIRPSCIEVVEIGKQLLMTRGALTTFSIANDVAKYFAIVPALFAGTLPWLKAMDIMHLHSPTSAILSAVIFNALIIPALIPVALKGVEYQPSGRRRAAAQEPADLGSRRRDRAVHRHQADRRGYGRACTWLPERTRIVEE